MFQKILEVDGQDVLDKKHCPKIYKVRILKCLKINSNQLIIKKIVQNFLLLKTAL